MIPKNATCTIYNALSDDTFKKHVLEVFFEADDGIKPIEKGVERASSVNVYIDNEIEYIPPEKWLASTAEELAGKLTVRKGDVLYFGDKGAPDTFKTDVEIITFFGLNSTYRVMNVYPAYLPGGKLSHIEVKGE